jgi:hypothetical protein
MTLSTQSISPSGAPRFARDPATQADELGPLAGLVGTWVGANGWELIAVPDPKEDFVLLIIPYVETLNVTPIGAPVPNRSKAGPSFVNGVMYETRITSLKDHGVLHVENGMWLYLGEDETPSIARLSAIPHGDSVLALGKAVTSQTGPEIPELPSTPADIGTAPFGYLENYTLDKNFPTEDANTFLREAISKQTISQTVTIDVSTAAGGGVLNIPFIEKNADASSFSSTWWIETVESSGVPVMQLQYSQKTSIDFLQLFGGPEGELIQWPHININTLFKQ